MNFVNFLIGVTSFCLLLLLTHSASLSGGDEVRAPAPQCPTDGSCQLPTCHCASTTPPGGLFGPNVPQIVYLTFDDAVTIVNHPFYASALFNRKNPNGASISATFFITHEYSNYSLVHDLYRKGHEIALHSITHTTTTQYWANMNESGGLTWECSRPTYTYRKPGLWPYTNDFRSIQDCQIAPCPDEAFPGFWTVPMLDFIGDDGFPCAMVDECTPVPKTQQDTFSLLLRNFNDLYTTNRAPMGVFTHSAWLIGPVDRPEFAERMAGYLQFLDHLGSLPDVYMVSVSQALEWVKNPTGVADIDTFQPWAPKPEATNNCVFPRNCRYDNSTWERFMSACVPCPLNYPWVYNNLGVN
ncbi:Chitooligosaccharide deacetylase [Folsomia candida]|uniref:Chitooligosaccharide deacetylase n=1 Tax=Folsomia candida TaxID=158441 RepID=A0A226DZA0_FOLCA|nr:Chitooligosaccharide deacetylase [Folsomia candida]